MLNQVTIKNFKSIRDLEFAAKRVNVFIGEPNTGKSNILEALAFFSPGTFAWAKEVLRFRETPDLFFDQKVTNDISIQMGSLKWVLKFSPPDAFSGAFFWRSDDGLTELQKAACSMNHNGFASYSDWVDKNNSVRYYRFKALSDHKENQPGVINPPFGNNLVTVLYSNENLNKQVKALFRSKGFRLQFKPTTKEISLTKEINDELYSYPWESVSETMCRIVFFMAILETNREAALLLDEPETNTFPFYTTYLAERIALDESNQFFLTTHNPYVLGSIVGKTAVKDLSVFVTTMENYETKLKLVTEKGLSRILEYGPDAFLNLEKLTEA